MVELIEYVIAFTISAGLAGASVALVQGALPGLDQVMSQSKADQIASAARISVAEDRNTTLVLPLQQTSVSCESGTLDVSIGGVQYEQEIGFPCAFASGSLTGLCTLSFAAPQTSLTLEAAC